MRNNEENTPKELSHQELWINTQYFIEAIRCVYSLLYFWENISACEFIDAHDFVDGKLHKFYINLCALVDIHCAISKSKTERGKYKKTLKTMCPSFDWIFYERDKNAAHKDSDYIVNLSYTPDEMAAKIKKAIADVQNVCANVISPEICFNYYAYDPLLFRYIHGITPEIEKKFNKVIYHHNELLLARNDKVPIFDPRQIRSIHDNKNCCVIGKNGLMGQPYEMLQRREDLCISINVVFGEDIWVENKHITIEKDESLNLIKEALSRYENHPH